MVRKGFTLIELIVVIAIIAVLAAIIAPNAFRAIEKAKISASEADFKTVKTAAMAFYADVGDWPETGCEERLIANTNIPSGANQCIGFGAAGTAAPNWDGPYLEQWPTTCRWGGTAQTSATLISTFTFVNTQQISDNAAGNVPNIDWRTASAAAGAAGTPTSRYLLVGRDIVPATAVNKIPAGSATKLDTDMDGPASAGCGTAAGAGNVTASMCGQIRFTPTATANAADNKQMFMLISTTGAVMN
jgi:type II secretion system protein G